jgi:eukaryotic-like serine/threonine-protein kinase
VQTAAAKIPVLWYHVGMLLDRKTLGKYRIVKRLGSGGFGSVYLATDTWVKRKVALKIPHNQGQELEKMLHEPRLQASLSHPNIVQIYSVEKKEGIFFIVSEYISGPSLDRLIKDSDGLKWEKAISIIFQVCDALKFAHDHQIIHRDIRPANVLLTEEGFVKMTDFGTSRYLNPESIAVTRVGCPPYMAPEHFEGKAVFQSDIYSVGMMFYEMIMGKLPFESFNPLKIEKEVKERLFTALHEKVDNLTPNQSAIIMKALAKNYNERYSDAADFKKAIIELQASNTPPEMPRSETPQPSNRETPDRTPSKKVCFNCGKLLSPRARVCPYCYQEQD